MFPQIGPQISTSAWHHQHQVHLVANKTIGDEHQYDDDVFDVREKFAVGTTVSSESGRVSLQNRIHRFGCRSFAERIQRETADFIRRNHPVHVQCGRDDNEIDVRIIPEDVEEALLQYVDEFHST